MNTQITTQTVTPAAAPADPFTLLLGLVLESGALWGELATDQQQADARAMLDADPAAVRLHLVTRPRGGSKTTDLAAVAIAVLACQAPSRSRSLAYASDLGQASLLVESMIGFIERTPGLAGAFKVESYRITFRPTGASLTVEAADAAGAFGHRPYLTLVDEIAVWPETRSARRLWEALISALPKRPDARLTVITAAGDPSHWSHRVLLSAQTSRGWRVSQMPGPLPWIAPADLEEQERLLSASAYARLHLNVWTAAEDRLTTPEDLAACVRHAGVLPYNPAHRYLIGVDVGLVNDRTVIAVCHAEHDPATPDAPPLVVLDAMHVLQGTRSNPVPLSRVEEITFTASREYGSAPVIADPYQMAASTERLRARGVRVDSYNFTSESVGRLASSLHIALRDHRVALPDDEELLDELGSVRLRAGSVPGTVRLDHDSSRHDDRAVALGLAVLNLTSKSGGGRSSIHVPSGSFTRTLDGQRSGIPGQRRPVTPGTRVAAAMARDTARRGPRGLPGAGGIVGVPGAWDDPQHR